MIVTREPSRRIMLLGGAALTTLTACTPGGDLPDLPSSADATYRLGEGDEVRVVVFDQKQLTADYMIGADGAIDIPLLGPIQARNRTAPALGAAIAASLVQRGILRHPSVAVEVAKYRPFSILGEVNKPGQYKFQPGMTVLTAVSLAGGFTYRAVESRVAIIRVRHGVAHTYRAAAAALINPGDVVKVYERHF